MGAATVRKVMDDAPLTCTMETDVNEVRRMMLERHTRYLPVMDNRMLMGVISFYDVAKAVVEDWRQQFVRDGWAVQVATLEDLAGTVALKKGDQSLTLVYTDTRFLPAEVTVQAIGVELERK